MDDPSQSFEFAIEDSINWFERQLLVLKLLIARDTQVLRYCPNDGETKRALRKWEELRVKYTKELQQCHAELRQQELGNECKAR